MLCTSLLRLLFVSKQPQVLIKRHFGFLSTHLLTIVSLFVLHRFCQIGQQVSVVDRNFQLSINRA